MYPTQTSKKRPCCLCSRSAGARSIQGPCQRLVTRNWPGSIGYAGAVPTRSTSQVANRIRAPSPSCVRGAGIGVRPRASSAPAGGVVAGLRARAPWVHTDFRSGGSGGVTGHGQGFFYRPPGPNRRPPVPVYRTGWTGYRLKPVKLKFEFKTHSYTGFEHLTGRLDRFTGPV